MPKPSIISDESPSRRSAAIVDLMRGMWWFDGERARGYRTIILVATVILSLVLVLTAHRGIDFKGKPLGTDFLAFWSASRLALAGTPAAAYDLMKIYVMERSSVAADPGLSSFLYPPPFLLVCLPLGLAPYFLSLVGWLTATGLAYGLMLRRWLSGHADATRGAVMTIAAYPAVMTNVGHGQNGFLTAALLGGGLWLLDRRPYVAGLLLGALVIKPQIAFAVPILVLASWRWRVMLGGLASAVLLCAASWLILGPDVWTGFLSGSATGRAILEQGVVEPGKMVSVFAAVQVLHGGISAGYLAQALVALGAGATLAMIARRNDVRAGGPAALCAAAATLMSPFFLDYDLTIVAIPLSWLLVEGLRRGFLPWEKLVLAAAYTLPLFARVLALNFGIPVGPFVLIALFAACARAALWRPVKTSLA